MSGSDLLQRKIIFFGGKGGAGKTACASATAFRAAEEGNKTLVFSSDPAHSLSDTFEQNVGNELTPIGEVENLYAYETDPHQSLDELKDDLMPYIDEATKEIGEGAVSLERDLMKEFLDITPPGLDELMSLEKLNTFLEGGNGGEYDMIVVDTAAGAHTLRLLESPKLIDELFEKFLRTLDRIMKRESEGVPTQTAKRHLAPLSELGSKFQELATEAEELISTLTDPEASFVTVTIPEKMGVSVTEDTVEYLDEIGVSSNVIIVNYLIPPSECDFCSSVRESQLERVEEVHKSFPDHEVIEAPLFPKSIVGIEMLEKFSRALYGNYEPKAGEVEKVSEVQPLHTQTSRLSLPSDLGMLIFGGKGGCGKTTCAAATGVRMAEKGQEVLVVSTDPQRSLSDSIEGELPVSRELPIEEIPPVKNVPNLHALEIDTEAIVEDFKKRYEEGIMQLASGATALKEEEVKSFFISGFPGADEVVALWKISKLLEVPDYDLLILDTAPTGHTMRFLELPEVSASWIEFLKREREKTKHLQKHHKRGKKYEADLLLEEVTKDHERIQGAFKSPSTEFVPVTTLDEMALEEVERFLDFLRFQKVPVKQAVVNKLVPPQECGYCISSFKLQKKKLSEISKAFPKLRAIGMPHFGREVRGIDKLEDFGEVLFGE